MPGSMNEWDVKWCPVCTVRALPQDQDVCPRCEAAVAAEVEAGLEELELFLALHG
jgi:hypothetical protein